MTTQQNIAVICPLADDCIKSNCIHKKAHLQELSPIATHYCGRGTNGCPACEVIPSHIASEETFLEEEFMI